MLGVSFGSSRLARKEAKDGAWEEAAAKLLLAASVGKAGAAGVWGGGSEVWRGRRWFGLDSVFGMLVGLGSAVFVWICLSVGENKGDDEGL